MLKGLDFVQNDKKRLPEEARAIIEATAKDIMNSDIVTATPTTTIEELSEMFATKRVNPIPIVDKDFKLVGVISRSDLIKLFSTKKVEAARTQKTRLVDVTAEHGLEKLGGSFALVSKTRAAIWLLLSLSCFVIGFILGVAWLVNNG
jgi:predicted transcriptional regulator